MPKVFIVNNNASHDYSALHSWGELVFLLDKINVYHPNTTMTKLLVGLLNFTPEDYLLLTGNCLGTTAAMAVLVKKVRQLNLLIYDTKDPNTYLHHIFDTEKLTFSSTKNA